MPPEQTARLELPLSKETNDSTEFLRYGVELVRGYRGNARSGLSFVTFDDPGASI